MRKLSVFNQVTLDGYFADEHGDMSWAHKSDPEWNEFVSGNATSGGVLVFGRITYEMMASYWPTPMAQKAAPAIAEGMNSLPKIVFSRSLAAASWSNTRLIKGNLAAEIRKLKKEPGPDLVILGSGTLVSQLAQENLIDDYRLIVNPIVLGAGKPLFTALKAPLSLELTSTRTFANGNVLLGYQPSA